jgi:hypothetical protein
MAHGQLACPRNYRTFSFSVGQPLSAKLAFSALAAAPKAPPTSKRARPRADVDGEDSQHTQKKKRRLRLNLITSRLSQPYATPTTYIISRANPRVARRTQQNGSVGNLLRKAAIMNWVRIKVATAMKSRHSSSDLSRALPICTQRFNQSLENFDEENFRERLASPPKMYDHRLPRPPSPLGLSNYDAIDLEEDLYDDDDDDDDSERSHAMEADLINSDFTKRQPGNFEFDESQFGLDVDIGWSQSRIQSSKDILELVTMEDSRKEVSFAQFGS